MRKLTGPELVAVFVVAIGLLIGIVAGLKAKDDRDTMARLDAMKIDRRWRTQERLYQQFVVNKWLPPEQMRELESLNKWIDEGAKNVDVLSDGTPVDVTTSPADTSPQQSTTSR